MAQIRRNHWSRFGIDAQIGWGCSRERKLTPDAPQADSASGKAFTLASSQQPHKP